MQSPRVLLGGIVGVVNRRDVALPAETVQLLRSRKIKPVRALCENGGIILSKQPIAKSSEFLMTLCFFAFPCLKIAPDSKLGWS